MRTLLHYTLTSDHIAELVARIQENAIANKSERKECIRISFILEEALLEYQKRFGADKELKFIEEHRGTRYRIKLLIPTESYDPFDNDEDPNIMQKLLTGQGLSIQWSYRDGVNTLVYSFKRLRKNSTLIQLAFSLAAAAVLFAVCKLLPDQFGNIISSNIIGPLYDTFTGLISFISGPLVLLSVMWGVYSIGDVSSLSNIGKRMITRFIVMMLVCALIIMLLALPIYPLSEGSGGSLAFSDIYGMILDIVPDNLIAPFSSGNTLQIIFIAVIFGIAMLLLSEKMTVAAQFVEQTNYIVQLIMEFISKLIPSYVFMSVFQLLQSNGVALLAEAYKFVLSLVLTSAAVMVFYVIVVSVHQKVSPGLLIKKMSSTFLIAVTTSSSSAAFADNLESCERKLGIGAQLVNIGVPLGQTIFMPGATILFFTSSIYMMYSYGLNISFQWVCTLVVLCTLLAIATPPVPGGGLVCFALIVTQMGLPSDSLAMMCALSVLPEFLATAVNISALQMELIELASGLGKLDKNILLNDTKK